MFCVIMRWVLTRALVADRSVFMKEGRTSRAGQAAARFL